MDYLKEFIDLLAVKVKKGTEITPSTELKSLGIDSLDLVEIVIEAEEKYKIEFTNEELSSFVTVSDVVNAIESKAK